MELQLIGPGERKKNSLNLKHNKLEATEKEENETNKNILNVLEI